MKAIFFDRDGVLLREPPADAFAGYAAEAINSWEKFEILPTVARAFALLKDADYKLFIVSNQEGIDEGFLSLDLYNEMNEKLFQHIEENGGAKIDAIYTCPHPLLGTCDCRKPKRGLVDQALKDYPDIELSQSWIIGDRPSDMKLGKLIGAGTIFLKMNHELPPELIPDVSLSDVGEAVDHIVRQKV